MMSLPVAAKVAAATVVADLAVVFAVVTELVDQADGTTASNAVLGTALLAAVGSLGWVLRAVITGRLVPENVAETHDRLRDIDGKLERIERRLTEWDAP